MAKASVPWYSATGNATDELVKAGYTLLHSFEVENPNTVQVYIQLFDSATVAGVTVGTTTPSQTYLVPAGDGTDNAVKVRDYADAPLRFGSGLVYAVTTDREGNAAPDSDCPVNMTYD